MLCSPRPYRRFSYSFRPRGESATFCSPQCAQIENSHPRKVPRKDDRLFRFPKSSFGMHKLYVQQTKILENGTACRECVLHGTLLGREYSIWATNPREVPRKHTLYMRFRFPTSSFGRHKLSKCDILLYLLAENHNPCGEQNCEISRPLLGEVFRSEHSHLGKISQFI